MNLICNGILDVMTLLIAVALLLLAFYALAVLTEDYFVPAIDVIAHKLKLSSDASGATLLAMGSSAPEFFTALIAVLGLAGSEQPDVGAGTIVGSALFNVLVIIGVTALFKAVKLQWKPILRDLVFYAITILMLLWSFWDGRIVLVEAGVFVLVYLVYVHLAVNWRRWFKYEEVPSPETGQKVHRHNLNTFFHRGIGLVIPDPRRKPQLYLIIFALSIAGIAGLSWLLVEQVLVIADVFAINATFLALTVLAIGTSVPDLVSSIVVAKQGRGDMAVSNAIGSNIFNVLFGLGVPWLIALAIHGGSIKVGTENLAASVYLLFATVLATLTLLILRKWHIGRASGLFMIGLYIAYCAYAIASL